MKKLPKALNDLLESSYKRTWKENGDTDKKYLKRFRRELYFADMFGYDVTKYKSRYNNHAFFLGLEMYSTEECGE